MRCLSCDCALSDLEATRRYEESNQFVDLCNRCMRDTPNFPNTVERSDLLHETDTEIAEEMEE